MVYHSSGSFLHSTCSQRSRTVNIDNRPESVVRVEGAHVHALFNFLLNSKTSITTTGAHAGIPPTLLAPVAFEGATLKAVKVLQLIQKGLAHKEYNIAIVCFIWFHSLPYLSPQTKQGTIQEHIGDKLTRLHSVDITGPILPQSLNNLCRLFQKTQHGDFSARLNCIESTKAFNIGSGTEMVTSEINQPVPVAKKNGLKEVVCQNGLYNWN